MYGKNQARQGNAIIFGFLPFYVLGFLDQLKFSCSAEDDHMGKIYPDGYYTLVGHLICIFEHISLPLAQMSGQNQDKPCKFF